MDYRFTPEEDSFRREVRQFLSAELPQRWDYDPFELHDEAWEFALLCHDSPCGSCSTNALIRQSAAISSSFKEQPSE